MTPKYDFSRFVPAILQNAAATFPQECCGFVVQGDSKPLVVPVRNVHPTPLTDFRMPDNAIEQAEKFGEIIAVYHSHPNAPSAMTAADLACYDSLGSIPWIVVSYPSKEYTIHKEAREYWPLIGRPFVHGSLDCYGLMQDYYARTFGIHLADFEREEHWWEKPDAAEMYLSNYESQGFKRIQIARPSDLKEGDGILMQLLSKKVNHAAAYIGMGTILHHVYGRLSAKNTYDGYWKFSTYCVLRHESLIC